MPLAVPDFIFITPAFESLLSISVTEFTLLNSMCLCISWRVGGIPSLMRYMQIKFITSFCLGVNGLFFTVIPQLVDSCFNWGKHSAVVNIQNAPHEIKMRLDCSKVIGVCCVFVA